MQQKRFRTSFIILFPLLLVLLIILKSCGSGKISEGVIEYEVTYPDFQGSDMMKGMLPGKMTMKFKDGKFVTTVSKGKSIKTIFIADCRNKTLISAFQFGTKKLYVVLTEKEINKMLKEFPKVEYLDIKGRDSLAGFFCKKKVAVFEDISYKESELWYTEEIDLPNPNWCYPYKEITGVLLRCDLDRYGLRMNLKAKSFKEESVADEDFEVPAGFKRVRFADLEKEIKKLFNMAISQ